MKIWKTHTKTVATKEIGEFKAREVILICDSCKKIYHSEELRKLVPSHSKFGFDVLISIGKALFLQGHNEKEIQGELLEKNINISRREIGYLGKKFIVYLALSHQECQDRIREFMSLRGGYILHLDGTCEKDSPHLISALDGITEIVLDNIKLHSSNADQIIPFLNEIKESYGEPIALVHDMGKGILNAVKEVFPLTANFICHYHFLRDIGKDLFSEENAQLRRAYTTSKIRPVLRDTLKKLKKMIDIDSELSKCLKTYLTSKKLELPSIKLMPPITAYVIIIWILEANCELNGFGFPFDRLYLVFYQRLESAFPTIKDLKNEKILTRPLSQLIHTLSDRLK